MLAKLLVRESGFHRVSFYFLLDQWEELWLADGYYVGLVGELRLLGY